MFDVVPMLLALLALGVSLYSQVWAAWLKPFQLTCSIPAVIWREGPDGRPDVGYTLIASLIMSNVGARSGLIDGVYLDLIHQGTKAIYRLEAVAIVDPVVEMRLASAPQDERAEAVKGVGGLVYFQKYETRELGVLVSPSPSDALRHTHFTPHLHLIEGDYEAELWCHIPGYRRKSRRWQRVATTILTARREVVGRFAVNITGSVYDDAPFAPRSQNGNLVPFAFETGARVRLVNFDPLVDGAVGTVDWRGRSLVDNHDLNSRYLENMYAVQLAEGLITAGEKQLEIA